MKPKKTSAQFAGDASVQPLRWTVFFGDPQQAREPPGAPELLGGKGYNLLEMTQMGFPVPPGFILTTAVCKEYHGTGGSYPVTLVDEVNRCLKQLEQLTGKGFGDPNQPLLVSVRSGAPVSMPGMMDTVLNLGLNPHTLQGLVTASGDERFAKDAYRRFIHMYSSVVLGVPHAQFQDAASQLKQSTGISEDHDVDPDKLIARYLNIVAKKTDKPFPSDPMEQLWGAIGAVFSSWNSPRAKIYRKIHHIPDTLGTAVTVQAMVFGNRGKHSGTGVAFTRDPATGEDTIMGEFLINAQGEDVVAGIRTPCQISLAEARAWAQRQAVGESERTAKYASMEEAMPAQYRELIDLMTRLETHYRDMQDIEFTVENGRLWLLQTRNGKRTGRAAVRIAVEMENAGLITRKQALLRVPAEHIEQLLHPGLPENHGATVLARGLAASPGAASGQIVFDADKAVTLAQTGTPVLLLTTETSPEDVHGMHAAQGVLTARGGMTSHAAVVARGMGRCCIAGCGALSIDLANRSCRIGDHRLKEGDWLTLNGNTGEVLLGRIATIETQTDAYFDTLMQWADEARRLQVWCNADTPEDARRGRQFGAQGIGLCRTEHMFFDSARITHVRQMIVAESRPEREKALQHLLRYQRDDFRAIFREMDGLPVCIRLLDPPLHEFLPNESLEMRKLSKLVGKPVDEIIRRVSALHEINPMLGHRGCRLGITYPEIYRMQARAIMEAACELSAEGVKVLPEIMIPLVALPEELVFVKQEIEAEIALVMQQKSTEVAYSIGTMIELPRASLVADKIAETASFFSFGTNDLTQTTMGLSRDDAGRFLGEYQKLGILSEDPFVGIDEEGVGALVKIGVDKGRATRPDIKLGVCGEHGGHPQSIDFFHKVGLNYVSCSPYRVAIARLAAAQAAVR